MRAGVRGVGDGGGGGEGGKESFYSTLSTSVITRMTIWVQ